MGVHHLLITWIHQIYSAKRQREPHLAISWQAEPPWQHQNWDHIRNFHIIYISYNPLTYKKESRTHSWTTWSALVCPLPPGWVGCNRESPCRSRRHLAPPPLSLWVIMVSSVTYRRKEFLKEEISFLSNFHKHWLKKRHRKSGHFFCQMNPLTYKQTKGYPHLKNKFLNLPRQECWKQEAVLENNWYTTLYTLHAFSKIYFAILVWYTRPKWPIIGKEWC